MLEILMNNQGQREPSVTGKAVVPLMKATVAASRPHLEILARERRREPSLSTGDGVTAYRLKRDLILFQFRVKGQSIFSSIVSHHHPGMNSLSLCVCVCMCMCVLIVNIEEKIEVRSCYSEPHGCLHFC